MPKITPENLYEALGLSDSDFISEEGESLVNLSTSLEELDGDEFAKAIVKSREYRASLIRRVQADELAPAIEKYLLERALGPVTNKVEHTGKLEVTRIERVIIDAIPDETKSEDEVQGQTNMPKVH